jgi:hypothetical protein
MTLATFNTPAFSPAFTGRANRSVYAVDATQSKVVENFPVAFGKYVTELESVLKD